MEQKYNYANSSPSAIERLDNFKANRFKWSAKTTYHGNVDYVLHIYDQIKVTASGARIIWELIYPWYERWIAIFENDKWSRKSYSGTIEKWYYVNLKQIPSDTSSPNISVSFAEDNTMFVNRPKFTFKEAGEDEIF